MRKAAPVRLLCASLAETGCSGPCYPTRPISIDVIRAPPTLPHIATLRRFRSGHVPMSTTLLPRLKPGLELHPTRRYAYTNALNPWDDEGETDDWASDANNSDWVPLETDPVSVKPDPEDNTAEIESPSPKYSYLDTNPPPAMFYIRDVKEANERVGKLIGYVLHTPHDSSRRKPHLLNHFVYI